MVCVDSIIEIIIKKIITSSAFTSLLSPYSRMFQSAVDLLLYSIKLGLKRRVAFALC